MKQFPLVTFAAASLPAFGQGRPDSSALIAAQREATAPLAVMYGVWRVSAWTILPSSEKHTITQGERIGPFLDGLVLVRSPRLMAKYGRSPQGP